MRKEENDRFVELALEQIHGALDPDQAEEFHLLMEKKENEELFNQIESTKNKIQKTEFLNRVSNEKSQENIAAYFKGLKVKPLVVFLKYAAIVVIAFTLGDVFNLFNVFNATETAEIFVPYGQTSELTMFDGTKVWLNSGSTLSYNGDFGKNNRSISFEGEAYFQVKPGDIPFKIKLKSAEVEVLGTSFNVFSYKEDAYSNVVLVKGKVEINDLKGGQIAELKPSEQFVFSDDLKDKKFRNVDVGSVTDRITGKIMFKERRLMDITRNLERWYNLDIRFVGDQVNNLRFSGTIVKDKPFEQVMEVFEALLPVKIDYKINPNNKDLVLISLK